MRPKFYILIICGVLASASAWAQPTITKGAATFTEGCAAWKDLGDINVDENANGDFAASQTNKTYVLQAPAGFEFNTTGASVSKQNGRDITSVAIGVTSSTVTVTITTDGTANKDDNFTISGLQMKITTATVAGGPKTVTFDAGTSTGSWNVADGTNHADLTVIAGGGTIESNGTGGGDWSVGATWNGAVVPTACDNVIIKAGDAVTVNNDYSCSDLEIENTATLSHDNNDQIDVYGDYTNDGTHDGGNANSYVYLQTAGATISGNGSFAVSAGMYVMYDMSIDATASLSFTKPINIAAGKTLTNNGTITTTSSLNGTGIFLNSATGTLNIGGNISGTLTASASGNLVNWNGTAAQNIQSTTYYDVTFGGSSNKTLQGNITVNRNLTLNAGPTLATSTFNISVAGNWTNNGGVFNHNNTCTVTLNGTADQNIKSSGEDFYALTLNNTGAGGSDDYILTDALAVTSNLTISDGDLNANGANITVGGNWNNTGGTFTHGGANSVTFNGTAADQTITSNGSPFYNLVINNTAAAGNDDILMADALTVNNTLTITDGDLNANAFNIILGGNWTNTGGSFTHGGGGSVWFSGTTADQGITSNGSHFWTLQLNNTGASGNDDYNLGDDLFVDGTINLFDGDLNASGRNIEVGGNWRLTAGTFTHGGSGTVTLNGGSAQLVTPVSSPFYNLTIANTSGDVTTAGDISVNGSLAFSNGKLDLGAFDLTVTSGNAITGFSASTYVVTSGVGTLNIAAVTASRTFPVGTSTTSYTPLTIDNSAGASGQFDVRVCDNVYDDGTCGGTQVGVQVSNKTWQVSTNSGSPIADITAQWNAADETGDFDRANSYISIYTGGAWDQQGATAAAGGSNPYTVTASAVTNIGPMAVGGGLSSPLPIELLSFDATPEKGGVDLTWVTASEQNNDYFTVEKSLDGIIYQEVLRKQGAGNSITTQYYAGTDEMPYTGMSYYRLKQTDYNGDVTYSSPVAVYIAPLSEANASSKPSLGLFPNPTSNDEVNVRLTQFNENEEVLVVVMDNNGKEYYSKVILTNSNGEAVSAIDPYQRLSPGLYMVIGSSNQSIASEMLIITR